MSALHCWHCSGDHPSQFCPTPGRLDAPVQSGYPRTMSIKTSAEFAQVTSTEGDTLLTSANLVEHRHAIPTDEISPDRLTELIPEQIRVLEHQLWEKMVAVDWGSLRTRIEKSAFLAGDSILVIRVDVL